MAGKLNGNKVVGKDVAYCQGRGSILMGSGIHIHGGTLLLMAYAILLF